MLFQTQTEQKPLQAIQVLYKFNRENQRHELAQAQGATAQINGL